MRLLVLILCCSINTHLAFGWQANNLPPDTARSSGRSGQQKPVLDTVDVKTSSGFSFVRHRQHYYPDTFKSTNFFNQSVDMYRFNMRTWKDSIRVVFQDRAQDLSFVFPVKGKITSKFGPRNLFYSHFHYGTDLELSVGDSVVAAMDGTVRLVRNDRWGYGLYVVIAHKHGLETLYGHLSRQLVVPGQEVKAGELIGLGGSTGRSTGPHLHFEFRMLGDQFDPEHIVAFNDKELKCTEKYISCSHYQHLHEADQARSAAPVRLASYKTPATTYRAAGGAVRGALYHKVVPGNTLSAIAQKYGTTVRQLCALNGISATTTLKIGRTLRVR
jgi:murein DD-endopeptidase MepM/ murein hydrolase activator NlpD